MHEARHGTWILICIARLSTTLRIDGFSFAVPAWMPASASPPRKVHGRHVGVMRACVLFVAYVCVFFALLTVMGTVSGRAFVVVGELCETVSSMATTPIALRALFAVALSFLSLGELLNLPDVVSAKSAVAKFWLHVIRFVLHSVAFIFNTATSITRRLARPSYTTLRSAITSVALKNRVLRGLGNGFYPLQPLRDGFRRISRAMTSSNVTAPDKKTSEVVERNETSIEAISRAARLLQNYYSFQRMRHQHLRCQVSAAPLRGTSSHAHTHTHTG
jgi:hypothetical protein